MDKQKLAEKAVEMLRPFETPNLVEAMQNLSVRQVFSHPAVMFLIFSVFLFGIVRRSKAALLSLFTLFSGSIFLRYAMPVPGDDMSMSSMLPFIGGGLLIGGVIIYYSLIKSD